MLRMRDTRHRTSDLYSVSYYNSRDGQDTAGTRERGKGRGKGGHPWGRKRGGRDQHHSAWGGDRGDKSLQETLVRYPTLGVWGPPRCPYWPHLSAGNKVG